MPTPMIEPTESINNFVELITAVDRIKANWDLRWPNKNNGICFRGADDSTYNLNPSLLRDPYYDNPMGIDKYENQLTTEFRIRSQPLLGRRITDPWESMFIMQQYELPTRLLDWTRSLAVAAYFSIRNIDIWDKDGAIWVMSSSYLLEKRGFHEGIHLAVDHSYGHDQINEMRLQDSYDNFDIFNELSPLPIAPDQYVDRMRAQQGFYTLHAFKKDVLENMLLADKAINQEKCFLHKLQVPKTAKREMRGQIQTFAGIREEVVFPDIEGFARCYKNNERIQKAIRDQRGNQ